MIKPCAPPARHSSQTVGSGSGRHGVPVVTGVDGCRHPFCLDSRIFLPSHKAAATPCKPRGVTGVTDRELLTQRVTLLL